MRRLDEARIRAERKQILETVDAFLADRLRPDNPVKVAARQQNEIVRERYYERKRRE